MEHLFRFLGLVVLISAAGCGKKGANTASIADSKLFDSAPAQLKASWAQATSAMATNGYIAAFQALDSIPSRGLSPDQLKAVTDLTSAISEQMRAAASKGDASAKQAIEALRSARRR